MDNPKNILLTSPTQPTLACMQSLGRKGHRIFLTYANPDWALSRSKYCTRYIPCPEVREEQQFLDFLRNLIKGNEFDVLIPGSETTTRYCAKYQKDLRPHIHFLAPDYSTWERALNKEETCKFALENNIPMPATSFPKCIDDVRQYSERNAFPCVVKFPLGAGSDGVFFVKTRSELLKFHEDAQKNNRPWPVIQEFIKGDYYSVTAIAYHGKTVSHFIHTTPQKYSVGGMPPFSFSSNDKTLLEISRKVIHGLNWTGPINIDFLKDATRGFLLLEINPRFPGSLNFSYRMGVDLPWVYFYLAMGGDPQDIVQPSYREGVLFRSIFPGEAHWCFARRDYIFAFLRNFLRLKFTTNIYWDDPKLLLWQIKETKWELPNSKGKLRRFR